MGLLTMTRRPGYSRTDGDKAVTGIGPTSSEVSSSGVGGAPMAWARSESAPGSPAKGTAGGEGAPPLGAFPGVDKATGSGESQGHWKSWFLDQNQNAAARSP